MVGKTLILAASMMIVVTEHGSTIENTECVTNLQEPEAVTSIPDNEKIIADLIGHQMYVSEGLPGIWEFSSPADIQHGNIRTTLLDGDSLEFNFTLLLVDNKSQERELYRADTLITYKKTDESWHLVRIQNNSFKASGTANSVALGNYGDDC